MEPCIHFETEQVSGDVAIIEYLEEIATFLALDQRLRSAMLQAGGVWAESVDHEYKTDFIQLVVCTRRDTLEGFRLPNLDASGADLLHAFKLFAELDVKTVETWKAAFDRGFRANEAVSGILRKMHDRWDNLN